ncbi:hypothetical protein AJ79_08612 [Helicocarpus griseus UAMH5409]|uniref:Uncharacterized protein n=1 Tax=Helicocarpus griseus UAMH5409 TaxID=1447875 RepID=A0A2B7WRP9_9EURO|nr:hypothetical protein AJ79_08612 [Helicocarpus griseus UAMH5409]
MASSALLSSHRTLRHSPASSYPPIRPRIVFQASSIISSTSTSFQPSNPARQQRSIWWWHRRGGWRSQTESLLHEISQLENNHVKRSEFYDYIRNILRGHPALYLSGENDRHYGPMLKKTSQVGGVYYLACNGKAKGWGRELKKSKDKNGKGAMPNKEWNSGVTRENDPTESVRRDFERRVEEFKRSIDRDPYSAIFGTRLEPFKFGLRSLFGSKDPQSRSSPLFSRDARKSTVDAGTGSGKTTHKVKINEDDALSSGTTADAAFEFDPISGRMVPTKGKSYGYQTIGAPASGDNKAKPKANNKEYNPKPAQKADTVGPSVEPKQPLPAKPTPPDGTNDVRIGNVWLMGEPEKAATSKDIASSEQKNAATSTLDTGNGSLKHSPLGATAISTDFQPYPDRLAKMVDTYPEPRTDSTKSGPKLKAKNASPIKHTPNANLTTPPQAFGANNENLESEDLDRLRAHDLRASYDKISGENQKYETAAYGTLPNAECGLDDEGFRVSYPGSKKASLVNLLEDDVRKLKSKYWELLSEWEDVISLRSYTKGKENLSGVGTTDAHQSDKIHPIFGTDVAEAERHNQIANIARELREVKEATNAMSSLLKKDHVPAKAAPYGIKEAIRDVSILKNIVTSVEECHAQVSSIAKDLRDIEESVNVLSSQMKTNGHPWDDRVSPFEAVVSFSPHSDTSNTTSSVVKTVMKERHKQIANIGETLQNIEKTNTLASHVLFQLLGYMDAIKLYHEQQDKKKATLAQNTTPKPSQYRVLAYDSLTMEVKDVGISSGHSGSGDIAQQLHPTEALTRLNHPSRFLDYFPLLEAQGYEIVSGGGDILIFKRVTGWEGDTDVSTKANNFNVAGANKYKEQDGDMVHSPSQAAQLEKESIDQVEGRASTAEPQAEKIGKKDDDMVHSPAEAAQLENESIDQVEGKSTTAKPQVKETEKKDDGTVHSPSRAAQLEKESMDEVESKSSTNGSSSAHFAESSSASPTIPPKDKKQKQPRKTVRRFLLTGGVAGATCYALGVIAEYFRTGGQDGLGPRGFTGLEGR